MVVATALALSWRRRDVSCSHRTLISCPLRRVFAPPLRVVLPCQFHRGVPSCRPPVLCLRANPIFGVPTCHSIRVSTYRSHRVLPCHKIPKFSNHSTNLYFILTSIVPILQQRCPSKATSRRQRIMADHVVVKISPPAHHGTRPAFPGSTTDAYKAR